MIVFIPDDFNSHPSHATARLLVPAHPVLQRLKCWASHPHFLVGVRSFGVKPCLVFNKKNMINMFNATSHSIMIHEDEFITPIVLTYDDNETSCDLVIGSILSISSQMNITNYDKKVCLLFWSRLPLLFQLGRCSPHTTTTSCCQVAARLAGRATAEDLPVPLPAAVLVQVAGMPCALGMLPSRKWTAGTWKYTSWKRKIIIHPPPFWGFEMLVLGRCIGLITWIEWEGNLRVGGLLPPTYLGKWWKMDPIWKNTK